MKTLGPVVEPIPVQDGVGNGLPQRGHRVFGDLLALETSNPVGRTRVALDEAQRLFDIRCHAPGEILAIEDMDTILPLEQQARHVGLVEEAAHLASEEEHTRIAEEEAPGRALGDVEVDEHVLGRGRGRDRGALQPLAEAGRIEVSRVPEAGARSNVEAHAALPSKEVADLVARQLLGDGSLAPEEPVAALNRLDVGLANRHHDDGALTFHAKDHWRVAVAGQVLNPRAERVGIGHAPD